VSEIERRKIMRKLKGVSYRILIFIIFLVGSLAFSGSVSAIELAYDDGSCTSMYAIHGPSGDGGPQIVRQRFLLSDFGLSSDDLVGKDIKVRIHWGSTSSGTDFAGVIKLWESDVIELTQSFVNPPLSAWQDFDFSGMGFSSSDFYVEVLWTSGWGYVCEENNTPVHNMAETDPGTGYWYEWEYDMGIRVEVRERPLGALPVTQCINLVEIVNPQTGVTEKLSARVTNDFDGCITEASARFYKSLDCTGTPIQPLWENPDPNVVYKSGTLGGCAEAVEVRTGSPVCVDLTLKSGRKTHVCY
jgi:hypothetical protein